MRPPGLARAPASYSSAPHASALLSSRSCQGNGARLCSVGCSGTRMCMRLVLLCSLAGALALCRSSAHAEAPVAAPPAPAALNAEQRALFLGSAEDAPAAELGGTTDKLEGQHYVTSNENAVQRFEPSIRGLGG